MFGLCSTFVSNVLDNCSDFTRRMFCLSRLKMGMFWLCSTYISIMLVLGFVFLDHNWVWFDCARRVFWLFPAKLGKFRLWSKFVSIVLMKIDHILTHIFRSFWQNGHTSTVLDLCFDSARLRFCFSRSQLGMVRLCWKYVSTFLIKVGHFLTVLNLCFDIAWPLFRRSRPKMAIIWLCSIFVLFFSIYVWLRLTCFLILLAKNGNILIVLDVCCDYCQSMFQFFPSKLGMFRLWFKYVSVFMIKMGIFWLCSTCGLDFLDLSFDCARPFFRLFRPKWAIFDCARPMFRLLSTYVSIFFDLNLICLDCARPLFRLCSTIALTLLGLCFVFHG